MSSTNNSTTIHLIDSDPATRSAVDEIAKARRVHVEHYENAESFLLTFPPLSHGCVVSEFRLLGMNGIALQEELASKKIHIPIIFITAFAETAQTIKAIRAGAITVLDKPFSRQDLWDALQIAFSTQDNYLRVDAKHTEIRNRLSLLTPKERQVLEMIVAGRPNKTIANQLAVSVRTVEARRHQIFKKAGAESVAELVKLFIESKHRDSNDESGRSS